MGRALTGESGQPTGGLITYSYTQISQYLTCPRRYRHRYLDGWKEKDTRAAMVFGRAFERALGAYFRREDAGAVLFAEWSTSQKLGLHYADRAGGDGIPKKEIVLGEGFGKGVGVGLGEPHQDLQIKFS